MKRTKKKVTKENLNEYNHIRNTWAYNYYRHKKGHNQEKAVQTLLGVSGFFKIVSIGFQRRTENFFKIAFAMAAVLIILAFTYLLVTSLSENYKEYVNEHPEQFPTVDRPTLKERFENLKDNKNENGFKIVNKKAYGNIYYTIPRQNQ